MIRIVLPQHLQTLAGVSAEIRIDVASPCTQQSILDALEQKYPALRGTIRDHSTHRRRSFVRFFACGEDLSHEPPDSALPDPVVRGQEPFLIVGAMAGG